MTWIVSGGRCGYLACRHKLVVGIKFKPSLSGSFIRVSFTFNRLPHKHFCDMATFLRRENKWVSYYWYNYQLYMSHDIKCLWNYRMELSIKSRRFIPVSFYFIWHGSPRDNAMKLSTETKRYRYRFTRSINRLSPIVLNSIGLHGWKRTRPKKPLFCAAGYLLWMLCTYGSLRAFLNRSMYSSKAQTKFLGP
jgi:hypothetical protein